MGSFNFKSVGQTTEERQVQALVQTILPIGIKTPLRLGTQEGILAMHLTLADQVNDNLRNLIMTNWGERVGLYDFGANLRPLLTELVSLDNFDAQAVERISNSVSRWMPFISLDTFVSEIDRTQNKNTAVIRLTITYSVPALQVFNKALQVNLFAI